MNQIDINKIIDDAMEKKDRMVHIFMMGDTLSVDVQPLEANDPRWIIRDTYRGNSRFPKREFECSECHTWHDKATPYCPDCGEKLRMPVEEDFKKESVKEEATDDERTDEH
jgi:uncharacterized paraquat-inducible protein A